MRVFPHRLNILQPVNGVCAASIDSLTSLIVRLPEHLLQRVQRLFAGGNPRGGLVLRVNWLGVIRKPARELLDLF